MTTEIVPSHHVYGSDRAAFTLVEYAEFECPHCGRAHFQLKALREHLADLDARLVFRHFARDEVHPFSVRAAVAAEAAAVQGRVGEMHVHLIENQHSLEYVDLERHAAAIGLDVDRFLRDMNDPRHLEVVNSHRDEAHRMGVASTPTFFINDTLYEGEYDVSSLIDALSRTTVSTQ